MTVRPSRKEPTANAAPWRDLSTVCLPVVRLVEAEGSEVSFVLDPLPLSTFSLLMALLRGRHSSTPSIRQGVVLVGVNWPRISSRGVAGRESYGLRTLGHPSGERKEQ